MGFGKSTWSFRVHLDLINVVRFAQCSFSQSTSYMYIWFLAKNLSCETRIKTCFALEFPVSLNIVKVQQSFLACFVYISLCNRSMKRVNDEYVLQAQGNICNWTVAGNKCCAISSKLHHPVFKNAVNRVSSLRSNWHIVELMWLCRLLFCTRKWNVRLDLPLHNLSVADLSQWWELARTISCMTILSCFQIQV